MSITGTAAELPGDGHLHRAGEQLHAVLHLPHAHHLHSLCVRLPSPWRKVQLLSNWHLAEVSSLSAWPLLCSAAMMGSLCRAGKPIIAAGSLLFSTMTCIKQRCTAAHSTCINHSPAATVSMDQQALTGSAHDGVQQDHRTQVLKEDAQEGLCIVQDCGLLHAHICVLGHQAGVLCPLVALHLPHGL